MSKSASVRSRSFVRGALAVSLLSLGGCKVYDPSLVTTDGMVPIQNCTAGSTGCIPARPAASTSSATDSVDMTFALRDILLEQVNSSLPANAQPWRSIGFNLDGIDTQQKTDADGGIYYEAPNGCFIAPDPDGGGPSASYPVDGISGIDNQFGAQLAGSLLPLVDANLQNDICCMQSAGRGTIMLRIRDWNGSANDAKVTVSITAALDGTAADPATLSYVAGTTNGYVLTSDGTTRPAPPSWIPDTDTWYVSRSDLSNANIDQPRHVDVNGYVSGGYFVMTLDVTQPIKLYMGSQNGIAIGLRYGTMIGHISPNRHLIDDGWIGGRMGSAELLDASYRLLAGTMYSEYALNQRNGIPGGDPTSNVGTCSTIASIISPLLDAYGDVLANGLNDSTTPCDALSAGVSFHGVRAKQALAAQGSISIPLPDCDGQTAVFGTVVPEESMCPFNTPDTCVVRAWNPAD